MKDLSTKNKLKSLVICSIIMAVGLIIFKYIPMSIWGDDILFDASAHIVVAIFILYIIWYFIDQNKNWRFPYLVFSLIVVAIISIQRILVDAHSDLGLILGLAISMIAIIASRPDYFKKKIEF